MFPIFPREKCWFSSLPARLPVSALFCQHMAKLFKNLWRCSQKPTLALETWSVWLGRDIKSTIIPISQPWAGTSSSRTGCSKPHPTLPWTFQGQGIHNFSGHLVFLGGRAVLTHTKENYQSGQKYSHKQSLQIPVHSLVIKQEYSLQAWCVLLVPGGLWQYGTQPGKTGLHNWMTLTLFSDPIPFLSGTIGLGERTEDRSWGSYVQS